MPAEVGVPTSLLGDSEATLRQVQGVLDDFEDVTDVIPHVAEVTAVEPVAAGNEVSDSEPLAIAQLRRVRSRLLEAALTTQSAASRMLDGLDRSLVLVDRIESEPDHDGEGASGLRNELRDELHQLLGLLQFQDITAQQLGYASKVVGELEEQVAWAADGFDVGALGLARGQNAVSDAFASPAETPSPCDPAASTRNAAGRQALADSVFK